MKIAKLYAISYLIWVSISIGNPPISLSGDDDGKHYILYPVSEDKNNWTYSKELIIETGGGFPNS